MHWRNRLFPLLLTLAFLLIALPAAAQDEGGAEGDRSGAETNTADAPDDSDVDQEVEKAGAKRKQKQDEASDDDGESKPDKERESEHGSYEWKPSYGAGIEYGLFFTQLNRWNDNLLAPNDAPTFDVSSLSSIQFAAEASLFEGSRFSLFAGLETPFTSNPELLAVYGGVEPAFAFRRDNWAMSLGLGVGLGSVSVSTEANAEFNSALVTLRPTFELRRYFNEYAAGYLRFGFNQWLPFSADSETLEIKGRAGQTGDEDRLYEGGVFAAIGTRFGHYPKHVKHVPDTDGDGLRDDVDDCDEKAEDNDGFEDWNGCPDPDNDDDGVQDQNDECPGKAEDKDGFEDDDGCPDPDNDGDDIKDENDECPDKPEDMDDFEDDDGCPDPDNDDDGVEDDNDECPDQTGIPAENGCPSEFVSVEKETLVVDKPVEFQAEKAKDDEKKKGPKVVLTDASKKVLDQVAQVLQLNEELAKVEVRAYPGADAEEGVTKTRAQAVVDYLGGQGVDTGRLVATGVTAEEAKKEAEGDEKPTARVEFRIEERSEKKDAENSEDNG